MAGLPANCYTILYFTLLLESELESPRVRVWPGVGVSLLRGDFNFWHILLLDCTLSLVLHGFGRCAVLVCHATSSMSCHHVTLFACTLLCTSVRTGTVLRPFVNRVSRLECKATSILSQHFNPEKNVPFKINSYVK